MKSILCVLITLTTLVYEGNGASIGVRAKLGETIGLKFGESIRDIEIALPEHRSKLGNDRKLIIEGGNITAYGVNLQFYVVFRVSSARISVLYPFDYCKHI